MLTKDDYEIETMLHILSGGDESKKNIIADNCDIDDYYLNVALSNQLFEYNEFIQRNKPKT